MPNHVLEMGTFEVNGMNANRVGECQTGDDVLTLSVDARTGEPIVESQRSRRKWRLRWQDICNIATNVGISEDMKGGH